MLGNLHVRVVYRSIGECCQAQLKEACFGDLSLERLFDASADELERLLVRVFRVGRVGIDS